MGGCSSKKEGHGDVTDVKLTEAELSRVSPALLIALMHRGRQTCMTSARQVNRIFELVDRDSSGKLDKKVPQPLAPVVQGHNLFLPQELLNLFGEAEPEGVDSEQMINAADSDKVSSLHTVVGCRPPNMLSHRMAR